VRAGAHAHAWRACALLMGGSAAGCRLPTCYRPRRALLRMRVVLTCIAPHGCRSRRSLQTAGRSMQSPSRLTSSRDVQRGLRTSNSLQRCVQPRTYLYVAHALAPVMLVCCVHALQGTCLFTLTAALPQESVLTAMEKNNALLRDRPIKVVNKRTNLPAWQVRHGLRASDAWPCAGASTTRAPHAALCLSIVLAMRARTRVGGL
jgi:hypothetical protein